MRRLRAGSVEGVMETGIFFCTAPFPPILHVTELPEFLLLMACDRSNWPRCLLWHGWLPGLSNAGGRDPRAASLGQLADGSLEIVLLIRWMTGAFGLLLSSGIRRTWPFEIGELPLCLDGW